MLGIGTRRNRDPFAHGYKRAASGLIAFVPGGGGTTMSAGSRVAVTQLAGLSSAFVQSFGSNVVTPGGFYMTTSGAEFADANGVSPWMGAERDDNVNTHGAAVGTHTGPLLNAGSSELWLEYFGGRARVWGDRALMADAAYSYAATGGVFSFVTYCQASGNPDTAPTAGKVATIAGGLVMRRRDIELTRLPAFGYVLASFNGGAPVRADADGTGAGLLLVPDGVSFPASVVYTVRNQDDSLAARFTVATTYGGDVVGGPVRPAPPIPTGALRTLSGLVFTDDFARPNGAPGANYTIGSGPWQIVGGKLVITPTSSNDTITVSAVAARRDLLVQVTATRASLLNYAGVKVRDSGSFFYQMDTGASSDGDANKPRLYSNVSGTYFKLGVGASGDSGVAGGDAVLSVIGNGAKVAASVNGDKFKPDTNDGAIAQVAGAVRLYAQYGGSNPGTQVAFRKLIVTTGRIVRVTGVPAGWGVKVGAATVVAVGGVVTLDTFGMELPLAPVVVDDTGAVRFTLAATVYGGDVYSLT